MSSFPKASTISDNLDKVNFEWGNTVKRDLRVMFPADQDIAATTVALDYILDAVRVVTVAGSVHSETEIAGER